jgi:hypothetical protein
MSQVGIVPVSIGSDLDDFINLPWKIYAGNENWVPPLKKAVRRMLDQDRHPFWKFSERVLFLARRGGKTVGRIAGIIDNNYNEFHGEKMGIWGFFECENDPEAAIKLFAAVENWTRQKGMTFLRGPLNPSTNYEIGMLVEGFQYPPTIMMTYNLPYYIPLVEACGFTKEKDLFALLLEKDDRASARVERLARRIRRNNNISIRNADKRQFESEMAIFKDIYNSAWSSNWCAVPMTDEEVMDMAKEIVQIMDPDLIFFIYYDDQPVGVCLMLPDINPLLKRLNGKIGLLGLLKYLLYKKEITGVRGLAMGFKKSHRKLGLPLVAFDHLMKLWKKKNCKYVELGWNLEDNDDINKFELELGCRIYKKYRIFRKEL